MILECSHWSCHLIFLEFTIMVYATWQTLIGCSLLSQKYSELIGQYWILMRIERATLCIFCIFELA